MPRMSYVVLARKHRPGGQPMSLDTVTAAQAGEKPGLKIPAQLRALISRFSA